MLLRKETAIVTELLFAAKRITDDSATLRELLLSSNSSGETILHYASTNFYSKHEKKKYSQF